MEEILAGLRNYLRNEESIVENWISNYSIWPQSHVLLAIDVEKIRKFVVKLRNIDINSIDKRFMTDIVHNAGFKRKFLKGSGSRVHFVALLTAFVIRHMILLDTSPFPVEVLTDLPFAQSVLDNIPIEEAVYLHRFHIALIYCDKYVRAKRNKGLFLKTCGLLEGSGRLYVTGGGNRPSIHTRRRVELFVYRTGVQPVQKVAHRSSSTPPSGEDFFDDFAEEDETALEDDQTLVPFDTIDFPTALPVPFLASSHTSLPLPPLSSSSSFSSISLSLPADNIQYVSLSTNNNHIVSYDSVLTLHNPDTNTWK